ncbi:sigma-70 family RNA polymerase sigma factor [Paenibacillus albiflavus]|uniref:Sigma-70 family RNA polymerase sigma factor n=1 Tax=Paenibacillus albiflavus TaxID=2545760 RepID=A0A4V2WPV5_9BACL|nr:RNA polymerase sigma factor SigJ [Paenibacillus albiflavus]TCZ80872.1 sigma-70 family RNA polymerase sigma factor [Paenibacillus albiflavus]
MDLETMYRTYKPLLLSVAYRMLGSYTEAEDAVQDVFITVRGVQLDSISNLQAYLVKMMTNHSLNILKSARRKRELYTGPWLPEPVITSDGSEPSEFLIQQESFGYALLVLMEKLTPIERAVFVLKESLGYDYREIAELLGKTEAACRKMLSRSKDKIGTDSTLVSYSEHSERFVQAFAKAIETGKFTSFIQLLTEDAVLFSDGGGKVRAALFPILGKDRVRALLEGIYAKGSLQGDVQIVSISGQPGIVIKRSEFPPKAICFGLDSIGRSIATVYLIMNPDKLTHFKN